VKVIVPQNIRRMF